MKRIGWVVFALAVAYVVACYIAAKQALATKEYKDFSFGEAFGFMLSNPGATMRMLTTGSLTK